MEYNSSDGGRAMKAELRVSIDESSPAGLESLYDWLRGEAALAGKVRVTGHSPQEGELGALPEALVIAVGSGGTLSVLAGALKAWISLPRRTNVRIQVHGADGQVVKIDAERINEERIDDLLKRALDFGDPES